MNIFIKSPCCAIQSSYFPSEVIAFDQWVQLKPEPKSMFSGWIKGAFHGGKKEMQESRYQKPNCTLSTAPMWDRCVAIYILKFLCICCLHIPIYLCVMSNVWWMILNFAWNIYWLDAGTCLCSWIVIGNLFWLLEMHFMVTFGGNEIILSFVVWTYLLLSWH